ncbi:hypothetical protein OIU74_013839 [Salix koriyanagi]|uniref:Uncharacterized protein n=1 Tax=Salix koriyanagi TaxID=2511006 RepID=A0A9Q0SYY1_9ROSI|nr:hypothetical protein OIU74_013839 [Salix koriyanagi]
MEHYGSTNLHEVDEGAARERNTCMVLPASQPGGSVEWAGGQFISTCERVSGTVLQFSQQFPGHGSVIGV